MLDPSRGKGAFYDRIPAHCERLWCEIDEGRDFFAFDDRVDWIVTNPPWSKIRAFLAHALAISDNVCFLATTNHAYTKARVNAAREAGFGLRGLLHLPTPPKPWPQSGFQLSAIWWQRAISARRKRSMPPIWRRPPRVLVQPGATEFQNYP